MPLQDQRARARCPLVERDLPPYHCLVLHGTASPLLTLRTQGKPYGMAVALHGRSALKCGDHAMPIQMIDDDELMSRAYRAYFAAIERSCAIPDQPSECLSDIEADERGRPVVVLRNCRGELARYVWTGRRIRALDLG